MIFIWIGQFVSWFRWLLTPPISRQIRKIDVNAPCPICGHCKGRLSVGVNGGKPACMHNCLICGGTFYEPPTVNDFLPQAAAAQIAAAPTATALKPEKKR
jgi:hypothetical protein